MAIADELIAILGYRLEGEKNLKTYEQNLKNLQKTVENSAKAIGAVLGLAATAAATAFGALGKSVITASATFEGYETSLITIEGSAQKARASLDWIAEFAAQTPYELDGVTEAFIKLKAYGIDPIANNTLRTLGDTASSMNKPLNQAVEAFADAATFQFERLKEFGIKAEQKGDQVTFKWTKNGQEMSKTVKKSAADVKKFLLETWGERFDGAMERQSKTWNGMMSNMTDAWDGFKRMIGEAGYFDATKQKLQQIMATIDQLKSSGKLKEWAKSLSDALVGVSNVAFKFLIRTAENVSFLMDNFDKLSGTLKNVAMALGYLVARMFPLTSALILAALALDDFMAYLQGAPSLFGDFVSWLEKTTGASKSTAEALAGLGAVVGTALTAAILLRPLGAIKALNAVLFVALSGLAKVVVAGLTAAFALLSNPIGWAVILAGVGAALVYYFWDDIKAAWNGVSWGQLGSDMGTGILNGLMSMGGQIAAWFESLLPDWAKGWFGAKTGAATAPDAGSLPAPSGGGSYPPPDPVTLSPDGWDAKQEAQKAEWERIFGNLNDNLAKMMPDNAVNATVTDSRQDNRQFPFTANVTVNQTVSQATNAPGQAAQATGQAVAGAVASQRSQVETEPSF